MMSYLAAFLFHPLILSYRIRVYLNRKEKGEMEIKKLNRKITTMLLTLAALAMGAVPAMAV
jgi:hypothetical protein